MDFQSIVVKFGTDPSPDGGEFKGEQTDGTFDPGVLQYLTTYYWRIDANNSGGTTVGDVWVFTTSTLPLKVVNPDPVDGSTGQPIEKVLSWSDGGQAASYMIYFGTDSILGASEYKGEQTSTTFNLGILETATTYYWRIDAKNSGGTTVCDVWSFTTIVCFRLIYRFRQVLSILGEPWLIWVQLLRC